MDEQHARRFLRLLFSEIAWATTAEPHERAGATMKIQKPSLGHVVIFTAWRGQGDKPGLSDEYAGLVVKVHSATDPTSEDVLPAGYVDLVTFGSSSVYHNNKVPYDASGKAGTWRYPPFIKDEIEVDG